MISFHPAAFLSMALLLPSQGPSDARTIEVDVNLVNIIATVQDGDGRFVDGLTAGDFRVLEDGREVPIEVFEAHDGLATSLGILVDNSGSSSAVLRSVKSELPGFIQALSPRDDVFVMSFASGVRVIHDVDDDRQRLGSALDRLRAFGTSVLFDALYLGIFEVRQAVHERQALIVLTDGTDNRSNRSYREVIRAAETSMAMLYFIAIGPDILVDRYTLEGLASATGGRVVVTGRGGEVADALDEIRNDLGRQYYLGYHASPDPGYHTVEVQVPGRAVEIRAREGYRVD